MSEGENASPAEVYWENRADELRDDCALARERSQFTAVATLNRQITVAEGHYMTARAERIAAEKRVVSSDDQIERIVAIIARLPPGARAAFKARVAALP